MTDLHIRILCQVARQAQRELEYHDAVDNARDAASTGRRESLERTATRTRARVAEAEQRRNRDVTIPATQGARVRASPRLSARGSARVLIELTAGTPPPLERRFTSVYRAADTPA